MEHDENCATRLSLFLAVGLRQTINKVLIKIDSIKL